MKLIDKKVSFSLSFLDENEMNGEKKQPEQKSSQFLNIPQYVMIVVIFHFRLR